MIIVWLGFFVSLIALLIISRRSLAIAMFAGALLPGVFTLAPNDVASNFLLGFTDPATVLLAITVGIIPIIGGSLKASGQMDILVNNVRIGKKAFLAVSPALIGMLPMPGGALLSCPLVEKGGKDVARPNIAGLNVWFRHVLYLVYPLAPSLIVSAKKTAGLDVYAVIPYLTGALGLSLLLGYFFFLRKVPGKIEYEGRFSIRSLTPPLTVIFMAPLLDYLLKDFFSLEEVATFIGVTVSLTLALTIGRFSWKGLTNIVKAAKPWSFAFMIIGIEVFLNIFKASGIPGLIAGIDINAQILCVIFGFLLGFGTGRIVTPAGIVIPIFLSKFGPMSPVIFAITYFSIFLGYILTPVHPCVSLTIEFFKIDLKDFLKTIIPPATIALITIFDLMILIGV